MSHDPLGPPDPPDPPWVPAPILRPPEYYNRAPDIPMLRPRLVDRKGFVVVALLIVAGLTTIGVMAATRGSGPKMTVVGHLTLSGYGSHQAASGGDLTCAGVDGYDDLREGTDVVVTDSKGQVVGTSQLPEGRTSGAEVCVWRFTVSGVPHHRGPYGVEIAHRGVLHYSETNLENDSIEQTIGDNS